MKASPDVPPAPPKTPLTHGDTQAKAYPPPLAHPKADTPKPAWRSRPYRPSPEGGAPRAPPPTPSPCPFTRRRISPTEGMPARGRERPLGQASISRVGPPPNWAWATPLQVPSGLQGQGVGTPVGEGGKGVPRRSLRGWRRRPWAPEWGVLGGTPGTGTVTGLLVRVPATVPVA